MNLFTGSPDLQHYFHHGVDWERIVPLWEEGFRFEDGPRSVAEAKELYAASLTEVGGFLAREVAPRARAIDEEGVTFKGGQVISPEGLTRNIEGLRGLGVMAVNVPREVGGFNFPLSAGTFLTEMLSRACTNTMLLHAFYQGPAVMVLRFGTPDQIERWARPLVSGEISGAVAMTEPDAGSDVGNVSTTGTLVDGEWRVSGRKQFITNGHGDVCVVLARTEPGSSGLAGLSMMLVPRRVAGGDNYRVARPEKKFVIRGSATCELAFDGARAELLGPRGEGWKEILTFMNEARLAVAMQGLGISEASLQAATSYAAQRVQMGRPIARHELVADMLGDMEAETAAMRALVYRCAGLQDLVLGLERTEKGRASRDLPRLRRALRDLTPLAKWFGAERTLWIARAAVQVHGGYGVVQEYDVERHYRNALILPIYEGTSQIQALMSLKDQVRWALERPWRIVPGAVRVEASPDTLGDGIRDMADEYNRTLRGVVIRSVGGLGLFAAAFGRRGPLSDDRLAYARLSAERLCLMLSYTRAAEALAIQGAKSPRHRGLAERFAHRALPLVRMHAEIVRGGDVSTLEAPSA